MEDNHDHTRNHHPYHPKSVFQFELEMGALTPDEAQRMEEKITQIVAG
jgi:hypothetical protein